MVDKECTRFYIQFALWVFVFFLCGWGTNHLTNWLNVIKIYQDNYCQLQCSFRKMYNELFERNFLKDSKQYLYYGV